MYHKSVDDYGVDQNTTYMIGDENLGFDAILITFFYLKLLINL